MLAQFEGLKNYNVKDGLPGSDVYGVLQDSKGYMWFIGDQGVSKFNGYTFKNFSTENGLLDNTIIGIYEDKKQRIWFRSLTGRLFYYKNDRIYTISCNDSLQKIFKVSFNSSIYIDEGDTIWLGATDLFRVKINPGWKSKDLKIKLMPEGNYFYTIGKAGVIFGGLTLYDKGIADQLITGYTDGNKKIAVIHTNLPTKKYEVPRYNFLRLHNGTYMVSLGKTLINFTDSIILNKTVANGIIIDFSEDIDHSIIVSTTKGVSFFSQKDFKLTKNIPQIHNKFITGSLLDSERGLWFTSEGDGVYYIPHRNFSYYAVDNGIAKSKISCIKPYKNQSVIVGFVDGSINILKHDTILNYYLPVTNSLKHVSKISTIDEYENQIYISNAEKTYRFTGKNLTVIPGLNQPGTKRLLEDKKDSTLWILNFRSLFKYDPKHDFKLISKYNVKLRMDNMYQDSHGLLWLCSAYGVYTCDGKTIKNMKEYDPLYSYRPVDIAEDLKNNIWIATRGGGVIIKERNRLTQLTEAKGLAGNMCKNILIDSNTVWVGTNKGLSKINRSIDGNYHIENMYSKDGLLNNEIGGIIKFNHMIWVAHNNGITVFDPAKVNIEKNAPPVYITQFSVNDSSYSLNKRHTLSFDQNYISISYEGLSYKNAGNIEYKYRIKGIDPDWVHSYYTTIKYQSLAPGNYTFEVFAKSNDGTWSKKPATLTFTILCAWWDTWWFITICIILSVTLVVVLFKYRLDSIRKAEFEKEMLRHRISSIELQALRSQMNPHFVFNAINSVQYFITDNDPESSQKYLEKFSSLIRYVLDNSKLAPISLKTEINALNIYMELEALRFKFNYEIIIKDNAPIENIYIPSMLIQPYVENAIWHGLMHKKNIGKIKITFIINTTDLKCIIDDNGIGRKRSEEIKLNAGKIETHKSLGMSITKERLDIINKINQSNLKVTITDKINDLGESTGTRVEIDIPF
ncbi:MAG: histidine kinase [Bacteroidota bacterium]